MKNTLFLLIGLFLVQEVSASVCTIASETFYYSVIKDGTRVGPYTEQGDYWSAIQRRDELIKSGECTLPVKVEVCDLRNDTFYYSVNRSGKEFTLPSNQRDYETPIQTLHDLVENHVCVQEDANRSLCAVKADGGYYYLTRDGKQWTLENTKAVAQRARDYFVAAGLCVTE